MRWLLLSIDRSGPSGGSPQGAPLFEIDDLRRETEPTTIGHGGAFQSPQWQAVFPTGRLWNPATGRTSVSNTGWLRRRPGKRCATWAQGAHTAVRSGGQGLRRAPRHSADGLVEQAVAQVRVVDLTVDAL